MHFLIIGNGFDIAHGFPTTYTDFLSFCRTYDKDTPPFEREVFTNEFESFIENNIWLKYFLKLTGGISPKTLGENWIDFEKEIAKIIQLIENRILKHGGLGMLCCHSQKYPDGIKIKRFESGEWAQFEKFLSVLNRFEKMTTDCIISVHGIIDEASFLEFLYLQLRAFTRAFEIYCLKINRMNVENIIVSSELGIQIKKTEQKLNFYTKQAQNCDQSDHEVQLRNRAYNEYLNLMSRAHPCDYVSMGKFAYVLSFNYTNTYERLYGDSQTKYCYIHGKAQEKREHTNLILGIDDNLLNGEESNNFCCIRFKKYYQRIVLKTGSEYKDWLQSGRLPSENYVHLVGHSLDRTDHDVLYEFFSDKRFRIIIYYYSVKDFEEKVQRVIQLLASKGGNGRDELISRVHGKHWSIRFTDLYDENAGLFRKSKPSKTELKEEISDGN